MIIPYIPKINSSQIGKKAQNVLYTDIKTYINGVEVTSYNIGGNTIIYFNDLSVFGCIQFFWNIAMEQVKQSIITILGKKKAENSCCNILLKTK